MINAHMVFTRVDNEYNPIRDRYVLDNKEQNADAKRIFWHKNKKLLGQYTGERPKYSLISHIDGRKLSWH